MAKPCTPHLHCATHAVIQAQSCQCTGSRGKAPCVLLGDLKGAILSRERMAPFPASPARRRENLPPARHKISAHDRNNGFCSVFSHLLNLIKMSVVQWIVFTNNSGNFHAFAASSPVDFCRLVSKKMYLCPLNSGHCFTILHEMVKFCNAIS